MTTAQTETRAIDQAVFRQVVSHFTSGVVVVTAVDGARYGVTASAVSSLSMDPPMLLVCLNNKLATTEVIGRTRRFAINILGSDHADVAMQFAKRHVDKFRGVDTVEGLYDLPLLRDALAQIECETEATVAAATHTIFIGRVLGARARSGDPLAYFRGKFGTIALPDTVS
jgi:flavin reductase (DIM6/NTAB) family NADH-FMN oxidoreductase RutF